MQIRSAQRGGTVLGLVLGLAVGVTVAVVVAFWFGKQSPVVNKTQPKGALSEADETSKNKSWNPNAGLFGKAAPASLQSVAASAALAASTPVADTEGNQPEPKRPSAAASAPVVVTAKPGASTSAASVKASAKAAASAALPTTPAPTVPTVTTVSGDTGVYFVQIGAFKSPEDANAQKAKLALLGVDTRVTEREHLGKTVYRVRAGVFKKVEEAEAMKARLDKAGFDTVLVKAPV